MTRSRAFLVVALPIAVLMAAETGLRAQSQQPPVTEQPMASRSGIDLAALDKSANPCDDFYQFACGGWMQANQIPADRARWARFSATCRRSIARARGTASIRAICSRRDTT